MLNIRVRKNRKFGKPFLWFLITACCLISCGYTQDDNAAATSSQPEDFSLFGNIRASSEWRQALNDPGTNDWERLWFLDGVAGNVANTDEGMILTAGPDLKDNGNSVVLWTRQSFRGDIRIEYDYTRLDQMERFVNILYIHATGIGDPPFVEDISEWAHMRAEPVMRKYFENMNLLHISYASRRFDVEGEYIRVRRYPVPENGSFRKATEVPGTVFNTGLFVPKKTYHLTIIKEGSQLFMHVESDGKAQLFQWDLSMFEDIRHGRLGLRHMQGRQANYRNFEIWVK